MFGFQAVECGADSDIIYIERSRLCVKVICLKDDDTNPAAIDYLYKIISSSFRFFP